MVNFYLYSKAKFAFGNLINRFLIGIKKIV